MKIHHFWTDPSHSVIYTIYYNYLCLSYYIPMLRLRSLILFLQYPKFRNTQIIFMLVKYLCEISRRNNHFDWFMHYPIIFAIIHPHYLFPCIPILVGWIHMKIVYSWLYSHYIDHRSPCLFVKSLWNLPVDSIKPYPSLLYIIPMNPYSSLFIPIHP